MADLRDNFLIEQYKKISNRIESHERIYYQMLVLYITVFGAVLGFSDKIGNKELLVPFILLSFLLFVTLICNRHNQDQRFETAYLIEIFEKKWKEVSFLNYMYDFKICYEKKSKLRKFVTHPIFVLFVLTIFTTIYFLRNIIKNTVYCTTNNLFSIIYLTVILLLSFGVLWVYYKLHNRDLDKYISEIKEYDNALNNRTK